MDKIKKSKKLTTSDKPSKTKKLEKSKSETRVSTKVVKKSNPESRSTHSTSENPLPPATRILKREASADPPPPRSPAVPSPPTKTNSVRVTKQQLRQYREILGAILSSEQLKNDLKNYSKKFTATDALLTALENFQSFENISSKKANNKLKRSIAKAVWDTVCDPNNPHPAVKFSDEIIQKVQKGLESEHFNSITVFDPAKIFIFDLLAVRLIPGFINSVREDVKNGVIVNPTLLQVVEKADERSLKKRRKSIMGWRPSPEKQIERNADNDVKKLIRKASANTIVVTKESWIDQQRKERELKQSNSSNSIPTVSEGTNTTTTTNSTTTTTNTTMTSNHSEPSIQRANSLKNVRVNHISWKDQEMVRTINTHRPEMSNSEKLALKLREELGLSEEEDSNNTIPSFMLPETTNQQQQHSPAPSTPTLSPQSSPRSVKQTLPFGDIAVKRTLNTGSDQPRMARALSESIPHATSISSSASSATRVRAVSDGRVPGKLVRTTSGNPGLTHSGNSSTIPTIGSSDLGRMFLSNPELETYLETDETEKDVYIYEDTDSTHKDTPAEAYEKMFNKIQRLFEKVEASDSEEALSQLSVDDHSNEDDSKSYMSPDPKPSFRIDFSSSYSDMAPDISSPRSKSPRKSLLTGSQEADRPWIIIRKLNTKRGGVKIRLPYSIEELIIQGSKLLGIEAIAVRECPTEAEILEISAIPSDGIVYLTTEDDELEFNGN
eukprot:TRINITY_DN399_c4_g1_i1.p1 TRINITY_DN399_c4_g1~~TRINITY_DN399_c4_g1_i1.p1  ORF type:complete len:723 (+),score=192.47 TRINITY_DN399_c4_g1_i1:36-2204(+)